MVHIDENGDAGGNYTIVGIKSMNNGNKMNQSTYGLFPYGTFITRAMMKKLTNESGSSNSIPVCLMLYE